jgi:glycosyltransferase involved in cell wall biosynthesis
MIVGNYDYGGVSRVVTELCSELGGRVDLTLICRRMARDFPGKLPIVQLRPRDLMEYWRKLRSLRDEFDIVHAHDLYALPALVSPGRQGKLVFTYHGIIPFRFVTASRMPGTVLAHLLLKSCVAHTDAVAAVSDYIYREVFPWAGRSIVRRIYNGIRLKTFRQSPILPVDTSQPTLLHVGFVSKHKGVYFLLRAFKRILRDFPEAKLVFVGQEAWEMFGRDRESHHVRTLVRSLRIEDRTTFCGMIESDAELVKRYMEATVVTVPSYWEGFGIPIIEAMSLGRPVIARDGYAMREHIQKSNGGILFKRDDVEEFLGALRKTIDNYDELSKNAYAYSSNFDSSLMASKYLDLYEELRC